MDILKLFSDDLLRAYFAVKNGYIEVTEEESNALWIGFMKVMEEKLLEESY